METWKHSTCVLSIYTYKYYMVTCIIYSISYYILYAAYDEFHPRQTASFLYTVLSVSSFMAKLENFIWNGIGIQPAACSDECKQFQRDDMCVADVVVGVVVLFVSHTHAMNWIFDLFSSCHDIFSAIFVWVWVRSLLVKLSVISLGATTLRVILDGHIDSIGFGTHLPRHGKHSLNLFFADDRERNGKYMWMFFA